MCWITLQDRDCATLVRPTEEESQLQIIDSLPESALRTEFRKQIAELKLRLLDELLRPKTMQGQFVTGRMLAGLAQAYVSAINAKAVPSIGNAWDGVTRVECKVCVFFRLFICFLYLYLRHCHPRKTIVPIHASFTIVIDRRMR